MLRYFTYDQSLYSNASFDGAIGRFEIFRQLKRLSFVTAGCGLVILLTITIQAREQAISSGHDDPIVIGLDADMSSASAEAGEAIRRGAVLAINEINLAGGVPGRPLELVVKDHRGNPARGIDNLEELARLENLVAVMGGLHTPVMPAELDTIHKYQLVSLVPWAAGTPIIDNGQDPNYVFRVSVRNEFAGRILVNYVHQSGFKKPGLLLEGTGWGRSNQKAIGGALQAKGLTSAGTKWFDGGTDHLTSEIESLIDGGADCVLLDCNSGKGVVVMQGMVAVPPGTPLHRTISACAVLDKTGPLSRLVHPSSVRHDINI